MIDFASLSSRTMHKSVVTAFPFFLSDYDANIITRNKDTIAVTESRDITLSFSKAERWHRPANVITWIMHNALCSNIINWCENTHPSCQHGPKLLFMWLQSCRETISHICMPKLIERDVGDKESEQRQLFVTSFHLTGIIRYMKLKFFTRGSCWQHYFLFRSSPLFSFVFLFMLIWALVFFTDR